MKTKLKIIVILCMALVLLRCADSKEYEIAIVNAKVAVGDGSEIVKMNVGINGDTIAMVTTSKITGKLVIEGEGFILAPGFIDIHTHCDEQMGREENKGNLNYLMQGVTSVGTGNCGFGTFEIEKMATEYEENGIGTNVIPMTGFGTIRRKVMGNEDRAPTQDELKEMKALLEKAMQEGSWAFTTGLQYVPQKYSTTEEVVELARVLKKYNAFYNTHMRSEEEKLTEAVKEAIYICKQAEIPLNIAHLKANGKVSWKQMPGVLQLIEKEQEKGMKITADMYPYSKSSTTFLYKMLYIPEEFEKVNRLRESWHKVEDETEASELKALFFNAFAELLSDPDRRKKIQQLTEKGIPGRVNWVAKGGWNFFSIVYAPDHPALENRMIIDIAEETGKSPFDVAADLIMTEWDKVIISLSTMNEENMRMQLQKPWVMLSSDGSAVSPDDEGIHPRNYGSQARLLTKYVKEEKVIPLEEAIYKMTLLPAQTIGIEKRGLIKEGYFADLVLFSMDSIKDKATFSNPHQYPNGIEYVVLNGKVVVKDKIFNNAYYGRVILKNKYSS